MDWSLLQESLNYKAPPASNAHKLSWQQVNEIREKYKAGNITLTKLAKEYSVNVSTVLRIVRYVYWQ